MSLKDYNKKRIFKTTSEPKGVRKEKEKYIFAVQRHQASHLHYDFRIESNGVLKSWAIPKGPSMNPMDKHLALSVEDHPIEYATFEGEIPEGNYGAGRVDIWDFGKYIPVDKNGKKISQELFIQDLKKGNIKFLLKGKKLKGGFTLVQLKSDNKEWLFIKHRDQYSTDEPYNCENYAKKDSLDFTEARKRKKETVSSSIQRKNKGLFAIKPMLAYTIDKAFNDKNWIFEIKWDGYRAITEINNHEVKFYSRNGLSYEYKYPSIYHALKNIKKNIILDGEIVAFDKKGNPSFQLLQEYDKKPVPIIYYVFDCLSLNGESLEKKTLLERKKILKKHLEESNTVRYCDHIDEKGEEFFELTKKMGLEGVIAKKKDSLYREGIRTHDWLKIKNIHTDEAIIAGFTKARGSRKFFGALILAVYQKNKLVYIGHVGAGFSEKTLKELYQKLSKRIIQKSPFDKPINVNSPVTWVQPELVCAIKFTEVTAEGKRRHPVFIGLREDKDPEEVRMD